MQRFNLVDNLYIYPTPGGAFHATSGDHADPPRRLLRALLQQDMTPELTLEGVQHWTGLADPEEALGLLHHAQQVSWVQGLESPIRCPDQPLEERLPSLLETLTDKGKVLLADSQGFYLAANGFSHEVGEELSALSAELANLNERRSGLLVNNLGFGDSAWALIDAGGCSKVGFWPLYIGKQRFVLVISGVPRLNRPDFISLIWMLSMRYAVSVLN